MEQTPQEYVQRFVTSIRRRRLAIVNSAGGGGGGTYPLQSLHGHGLRCRIRLKIIVIFTLFCNIFDQVWSLLKYWKNVNFDFTINFNFAFAFFNLLFHSKEINCNFITHISFIFVENLKMI